MAINVIGTGGTIVWGGATGYLVGALEFGRTGGNYTVLDNSTMATTGGKTFSNGSQIDQGTVSVKARYDPSQSTPAIGSTGTVLITWSDADKIQWGSGVLTGPPSITARTEEYVEMDIEIKLGGAETYPS